MNLLVVARMTETRICNTTLWTSKSYDSSTPAPDQIGNHDSPPRQLPLPAGTPPRPLPLSARTPPRLLPGPAGTPPRRLPRPRKRHPRPRRCRRRPAASDALTLNPTGEGKKTTKMESIWARVTIRGGGHRWPENGDPPWAAAAADAVALREQARRPRSPCSKRRIDRMQQK